MTKEVKKELNEILEKYEWETVDKIDWKIISSSEDLSDDFMIEFENEIDWPRIFWRKKIIEDINSLYREDKISIDLYGLFIDRVSLIVIETMNARSIL